MSSCAALRSVLIRLAGGDASPDESLKVARHLSDCTACRILLAREVRLEGALNGLADPIPVNEGFLEAVMRALPNQPARRRRRRRRRLALAGGGGTLALVALAAAASSTVALGGSFDLAWPTLDALSIDRMTELAGAAALWLRVAIDGSAGLSGWGLPTLRSFRPELALATGCLAVAIVTLSALWVSMTPARMRSSAARRH